MSATPSLQELTGQLEQLEAQAADAIAAATSASDLESLRVGLLGKKGQLSAVLGAMGKLAAEERPLMGQRANVLKELVQGLLSQRLEAVKSAALEGAHQPGNPGCHRSKQLHSAGPSPPADQHD